MDDGTAELTEDAIIRLGGWHPRYARVVLIEHDERHAVVLVDGNGDDSELELEYWHRDDDGDDDGGGDGHGLWQPGSSSGHGSLATMRSSSWDAGDFVAAIGRAEPGSEVSLEFAGRVYHRRANRFGAWGFVHTPGGVLGADLPAVTVVRPPQT